jgi:hypothetical protein
MIQNPSILGRPPLSDIKRIFPRATGVAKLSLDLGGLAILFNRQADFFQELDITETHRNIFKPALVDLVKQHGLILLKNCVITGYKSRSGLSKGKNDTGHFIQDPFHRDYLPSQSSFITVMFKDPDDNRIEKTFYAREIHVRQAIVALLERGGLSQEVVEALRQMTDPSYSFALYDEEAMPPREIIQSAFHDFTKAVYDLIPATHKYAHDWGTREWNIVIHSNSGDLLHARPTGYQLRPQETPVNPIRGLEIYKG